MDAYAALRWVDRCGPKHMFMKQEGKSKEKERGQERRNREERAGKAERE